MRRTIRRLGTGAGLVFGGIVFLSGWNRAQLAELSRDSELVSTARGEIEVARRGSGYPILVLHGNPGGYDQALALGVGTFGDEYEVIAPSRPGYLRTPLAGNESPADQAALLVALLDELDIEQAVVVGVSGGGPYALQLAVEYPERVSGLVLGSAVTTEYDQELLNTGVSWLDWLLTRGPVMDAAGVVLSLGRRLAPDATIRGLHRNLSTLEGDAFDAYVEGVLSNPEHRERDLVALGTMLPMGPRIAGNRNDEHWFRTLPLVEYGSIECPVLVSHGRYDAAVPMAHAEYVVERVPQAEFLRLDADHLAGVGPDADLVRRRTRAFVREVVEAAGAPAR